MPPRPPGSLPTTFSATDPANEITCPLINHDGSQCRKRCFGDKRFRSMQEHIRRAHPEHYIPKLPASNDSIRAMVDKIPDEQPLSQQTSPQQLPPGPQYPSIYQRVAQADPGPGHRQEPSSYANTSMFAPNHLRRGSLLQSANAAAALTQLHNSRPPPGWQAHQDAYAEHDPEHDFAMNNYFGQGVGSDMFGEPQSDMDQGMLQVPFDRSFFSRAGPSAMAPFPRKPNRPRKSSVTENARRGKHERDKSKDLSKRLSNDRKGMSLEPGHKRWEDLLDAAQSATEEESRDLTPIPQSPRSSMPPFNSAGIGANQFHSYTASPLQNTLLSQDSTDDNTASFNAPGLEPFPSVESSYDPTVSQQPYQSHQHQGSGDSAHSNLFSSYAARHHASSTGSNFHMPPEGLSSSSPGNTPQLNHFARPGSSSANAGHYPNPLQAAVLAHAANQHQQSQQHPYSAHHDSFTASSAAVGGVQGPHLQESTPTQVEHYCAACKRGTPLVQSYGCTECMCGICRECFEVLTTMGAEQGDGCPHCHVRNGKYKPFMLDLR